MGMLEKLGYVFEGLAAGLQSVGPNTTVGGATYGDVVSAITKCKVDSFWKNRMLETVPKGATSSEYSAAISVIEDTSTDGFWKKRSLEKVFGP